MAAIITTRKKVIIIILDILIWRLGHAFAGRVKRGIGIFLLGFAIMFVTGLLVPFPFSLLVGIAYLVWLIFDLLKIIASINEQTV